MIYKDLLEVFAVTKSGKYLLDPNLFMAIIEKTYSVSISSPFTVNLEELYGKTSTYLYPSSVLSLLYK